MKDNALRDELMSAIKAYNDEKLSECFENYLKQEETRLNAMVAKAFQDGFAKGSDFVTNMLSSRKTGKDENNR